ncbi:MAG TPA: hypothetical protein VF491_12390 [Vicinamibacterales bacterium]
MSANAEVHYLDSLTANTNNNCRLSSYLLLNLGVSYQTSATHHFVTLRAGADSVFNRNCGGFWRRVTRWWGRRGRWGEGEDEL